jgi:2-amino-4-hydroxy-6-hydroxymethyldihydropteridine diphosphokinase
VIGLGSNMGRREDNVRRAVAEIGGRMRVIAVSSVYETEPMYLEDQGWFLNCVVVAETDLEPADLLRWLKRRERAMGRGVEGPTARSERYGPRTIDMDILLYGRRVISGPSLEVPHPKLAERAFVLVPLAEVRPHVLHPVLGKTASELLQGLEGGHKRVVIRPDIDLKGAAPSPPRQRGRLRPSASRRGS